MTPPLWTTRSRVSVFPTRTSASQPSVLYAPGTRGTRSFSPRGRCISYTDPHSPSSPPDASQHASAHAVFLPDESTPIACPLANAAQSVTSNACCSWNASAGYCV